MIESKTSCWIAETIAVVSNNDKVTLTLICGPLKHIITSSQSIHMPVPYHFRRSNYRHFNVIQTYFVTCITVIAPH